ncbi:MAG: SUMF1/EgtB/PvdO family nonheme iron enzyme, partial [Prosthecobacter sp.]|nr:SUMF1/EgtB/PvdO family nonheme iron enzyme [Prosthecobacter sp.]
GPGDAPPDHRLATAATSRRKPLLLGTAAATLILSTAAWFLMDEPMEADSGPSLSSSPSLPLSKPSATETWINALTLETKLANQPADLTPEGLRLTGNRMMKHERAPKRDGALRMQTAFVSATPSPQLRVRNAVDDALSYTLHIGADGRSAFLKRVAKAVGGSRALGEFPLPKPLGAGEDYELELRAVGSHFTVKFNGQALGGAEDAAIAEGKFGIASASTVPVLVKTLEYLNLDGGTLSSSPSPPVSKSSAPTWRKAITRFEDLPADARTKATLRWNNGWLEPTSTTQSPPLVLLPGPKVRNGGIRVHGRMSPDIQFPTLGNVFLRRTPEADTSNDVYRVGITASPTSRVILMLANDKAKTQETLVNHPLQRTLIPGDEYELELIAIGDELHVRLNDERLRVMSDTRLKEGAMGLHCIHPMRDVEVIHLDGLSEAEARKMVGIEGRVASPQPPTGAVAPSALPGTASATKDAPFVNSLGMKFVPVPIIGGPTDGQRVLFCIWETRLQDFKTFSRETKLSFGTERSAAGPGPTHPVVTVTWDEAQAFCAWLTESERKAGKLGAGERYRLPSDHEWSCAVGIGEREDAALFPREQYRKLLDVHPWGTAWPPPERSGNFASEELRPLLAEGKHGYIKSVITGYRDGHAELAPVGSYPANALGLHDLAGNALEWCEDWFDSAQDKRVDRGAGSWSVFDRREMRSARRGANEPWSKQDAKGFRVVLALSEPASGSAAGPPAAAVPPKTVLGGPSALPKFPPGKWVKPWKNLEDIPDVRSDAEGWATLAASTAVANPPGAQGRNWGVRVWLRGLTSGTFKSPQLQLRYLDHAGYKLRVLDGAVVISRVDGDKMPDVELKRTHVKMPSPDQDCLLEFIAIGQSLHANVNGERVSLELPVNEQPQRQGEVLIYGLNQQPFRDIEVINLDGLSEAEALKIAGINVTPAAEPWQDVLRDPTKLGLTGGAERTLEGLRFAAGGHALLPAGQGPTGNGAVRMRATFGGLQVQLRARQSDATGLYQLYARENVIVLERKDTATRGSATLSLFPLRASLQPGQNYELELRVVGETFTAKLNGETLGTVTDGTYATGQFGVGVTGQDAAPALVESLEVLTLDGLPEAEG